MYIFATDVMHVGVSTYMHTYIHNSYLYSAYKFKRVTMSVCVCDNDTSNMLIISLICHGA